MFTSVAGAGPFTVDLTAAGKGKRLKAWHFSNTVAAAVINLRNGTSVADNTNVVVQIQLAVTTSASQAYPGPEGLVFPAGLFVQVVTGTVVGSVDI